MNIRSTAEIALALIASRSKGYVHASRRGIVACSGERPGIVFRRVEGRVRMEHWPDGGNAWPRVCYELPDDLEERAGRMLDNL